MKSISIFGFTGSIGSQALDIIEKHQEAFEIDVFVCKENIDKAINLINSLKNVFIICIFASNTSTCSSVLKSQ